MRRCSPLQFVRERRNALRALAAALLVPAARSVAQPALLPLTPSQPEGPFYPRALPAERDWDLTRIAGRAASASGTPLYFSGRVIARDSRPCAKARIELWQCDAYGRYHNAGDEGSPRDDNFQGGEFRLRARVASNRPRGDLGRRMRSGVSAVLRSTGSGALRPISDGRPLRPGPGRHRLRRA